RLVQDIGAELSKSLLLPHQCLNLYSPLGMGGQIVFHRSLSLRRKPVVEVFLDLVVGDAFRRFHVPSPPWATPLCSSASRRPARARESLDRTVPTGSSRIAAASS